MVVVLAAAFAIGVAKEKTARTEVPAHLETATLRSGCFWSLQETLRQIPGVIKTTAGYTGGTLKNPTYAHMKGGDTGHAEALKIIFDPNKTSFENILHFFFKIHDPSTPKRQGNDRGSQYRSAIFYTSEEQKSEAQAVIDQLNESDFKGKIATSLEVANKWWPAEDYHQKFSERTGRGMCHIPYSSLS